MSEEYDELSFDGLERRANYRLIAYREDVLHAFEKKDSAAIIYQILYRWLTEVKREEVLKEIGQRKKMGRPPFSPGEIEERMWVYMSYNDFVRESGHALGYNTVIRALDYLINTKKVIEQRANHDPRYPDFEYRINKEAMKNLLAELPKSPAFAPKIPKPKKGVPSTQMGTPDTDSTQMGTHAQGLPKRVEGSTQMGTEVYPNGYKSHNTHITTSQEVRKVDDIAIANTSIPTPSPLFEELGHPLTPSKPNDDAKKVMKKRIQAYCLSFQILGREFFQDSDFAIDVPDGRSPLYKKIVSLLESNVTEEGMRQVFQDMWDETDENNHHWWRDPKHLTLGAMTNHYRTRISSIKFKKRQGETKQTTSTQLPTKLAPQRMPTREELRRAEV